MALMTWRLPVAILLALLSGVVVIGVFQTHVAPALAGGLLAGIAAGLVWEAQANHAENRARLGVAPRDPPISRPVAFMGLAFFGIVSGAWIMAALKVLAEDWLALPAPTMIAAVLVNAALPFALAPLLGPLLKRRFTRAGLTLASAALTTGLLLLLGLFWLSA